MNRAQFELAITWWRGQDPPLILPFGSMPGEGPGGDAPNFTRETWDAYRWNPPATSHPDGVRDDTASPKPTWAMLLEILPQAELAQARQTAIVKLHAVCHRCVITAYGASSLHEEILLRLRQGHNRAQDAERDRLRALFHSRKAAINAATTPAAVKNLLTQALANSFWAPPPSTPPRRT